MNNFKNIKLKFPYFYNQKDVIYFDNASTSIKPLDVINEINNYYSLYAINPNNISNYGYKLVEKIKKIRIKIAKFLNASSFNEIIFTPSATFSLNQIAYGLKELINKNDEIIITKLEHSSNILPWYNLSNESNAKIVFFDLKNGLIDVNKINKIITNKTKIVSFANVTNLFGYHDYNLTKTIIQKIKSINKNILVIIDATQSIANHLIDVQDLDIDFLTFSAHKMLGPLGIGVLYGKKDLLVKLKPLVLGGGGNNSILLNNIFSYNKLPYKLEAGTLNVASIFGLSKALDFINKLDIKKIEAYVENLRFYAVVQLKDKLKERIEIYNDNLSIGSTIVLFNIKGINAQDVANFLGNFAKIIVRSGQHCARLAKNLNNKLFSSVRISFYFYNNKAEIDKLVKVLLNEKDFLGDIFNEKRLN